MSKTTSEPKKRSQPETGDERQKIFHKLKNILLDYAPPMLVVTDDAGKFELVTNKEITMRGAVRKNLCFASLMVQSSYVGLYLMHVYARPENIQQLGPELRKALKGKSCFHIPKLDGNLSAQIRSALDQGLVCYRELGFI
jgi:hypothetical protein